MTAEQASALIASEFGVTPAGTARDLQVTIDTVSWTRLATFVKDTLGCRFFAFSTAIDWQAEGLEVVARVENLDVPFSVTMRTRLPAGITDCPSLVAIYRGADWMERECFDMFGITFTGHPDLRRILLPDDWTGHPLLKSYDVDTPYPPYR